MYIWSYRACLSRMELMELMERVCPVNAEWKSLNKQYFSVSIKKSKRSLSLEKCL